MARVLDLGPNNTPVTGDTPFALSVDSLDWEGEFSLISEVPGKVVYGDRTAPVDRPANITIAQRSRANVYAGTSIDPSMYLPTKRGLDTLVEITQVLEVTDDQDTTYLKQVPVRLALTMTTPITSAVDDSTLYALVFRLIQAVTQPNLDVEAGFNAGLDGLLRGILRKS